MADHRTGNDEWVDTIPVPRSDIRLVALIAGIWIVLATAIAAVAPPWVSPAQQARDEAQRIADEALAAAARQQAGAEGLRPLVFVLEDKVNLRRAPSLKSRVIGRLSRAQRGVLLGRQGEWHLVALLPSGGRIGWVHGTLVGATNPVEPIAFGERYLPEHGFRSFFNEVDRLVEELDCPLPEVTLGASGKAPSFRCRVGSAGQGEVVLDGIAGSLVIRRLRFHWTAPDGSGDPALQHEEAAQAAGQLVAIYAPGEASMVAQAFVANRPAQREADQLRFEIPAAGAPSAAQHSLVITPLPQDR